MARTTPELVGELVEVDTDIVLDPFIGYANQLVTELCTLSGYSEERLTSVETWLAAHFYSQRDPDVEMEDAGDVRSQYANKTGFGFKNTRYGQQAMRLDTAGNLAALDNSLEKVTRFLPGSKRPSRFKWLGTDPCDS